MGCVADTFDTPAGAACAFTLYSNKITLDSSHTLVLLLHSSTDKEGRKAEGKKRPRSQAAAREYCTTGIPASH